MLEFSSTRIRPITGRHSLFPASYSHTSNSVPCGFAYPSSPGRKYGVSTFRVSDDCMGDLGPPYTPAALCPRGGIAPSPGRLLTFWFKPFSLIWLVHLDGVFGHSLSLTISPGTLALTRVEASRRAVASRLPPLPHTRDSVHCRRGYRTSMNAPCQHAPLGYPWGNTGSGQYLTGFSQTVIYKRDFVSRRQNDA
jgi:hypothetical protein